MKSSKLFGLGIILSTIGLIWLLNVFANIEWYSENVSSGIIFTICLLAPVLMAIGGFICIFAAFDR